MINVGVIDDGIEFNNNLNIIRSIEITSDLKINEIEKSTILDSKHGVICAAIIKKYYPEAIFTSVKVLGDRLACRKEQLVKAVEWCIDNKIKIINMSLGTTDYRDFEEIREVINRAYSKGVIIIAACNNKNIFTYPASSENVIGVKASEKLKEGEYIFNLYPLDGIEITACGKHKLSSQYITTQLSSNSFAAPMITAKVCKIVKRYPHITLEEVKQKLYEESINYKKYIPEIKNINISNPLSAEYFYEKANKKREIDVPLIIVLGNTHNDILHVLKSLTFNFRKDGYYAVPACTQPLGVLDDIKYVPFRQDESIEKFKDKMENLYGVYDCDIIILGIEIKEYLDMLNKIDDVLKPDIFILIVEKMNINIKKIQCEKTFIITKQRKFQENCVCSQFKYEELNLFYQQLLIILTDECDK